MRTELCKTPPRQEGETKFPVITKVNSSSGLLMSSALDNRNMSHENTYSLHTTQNKLKLNQDSDSEFSSPENESAKMPQRMPKPDPTNREGLLASLLPPANPLLPKNYFVYDHPVKAKFKINFLPVPDGEGDKRKGSEIGLRRNSHQISKGHFGLASDDESELAIAHLERAKTEYQSTLDEALKEQYLCNIIALETQDLKYCSNPVIFSRNGKRRYTSKGSKKHYDITMKVLQSLIKTNIFEKERPTWKWKWMDPEYSTVPYYTPLNQNDKTLVFESRFECGNLELALKISDIEYNLIMQTDTNTQGNTQWFYFSVKNMEKGQRVTFNVLNFGKVDSLYNYGMKVIIKSQKEEELTGIKWTRGGKDIRYYQNTFKKEGGKNFYTLTFSFVFPYDDDTVWFAYALPYSYTDLESYLDELERDPSKNRLFKRGVLCNTIAGMKCEYLTISNPVNKDRIPLFEKMQGQTGEGRKKGVMVTGRVHPGETVSSYMMKGLIDFLLGATREANLLRDHFIFKIVPMMNPDGVIQGNYRTSLAGCDLNRRYKNASKLLHPTIIYTKKLAHVFSRELDVLLYVDLHGHSRNKNVFMYGNGDLEDPSQARLFPFIMSKICPSFSFKSSKFGVQKSKASTARIAIWKEIGIPNVYTMEASFLGATIGPFAGTHFDAAQLQEIGKNMAESIIIFSKLGQSTITVIRPSIILNAISDQEGEKSDIKDIKSSVNVPGKIYAEDRKKFSVDELMRELKEVRKIGEIEDDDDSGSESNPSEDNMDSHNLIQIVPKQPKPVVTTEIIAPVVPPPAEKQVSNLIKSVPEPIIRKPNSSDHSSSPQKRFLRNNFPYKRLNPPKSIRSGRKTSYEFVEMVDAWTQTSFHKDDKKGDKSKKGRRSERERTEDNKTEVTKDENNGSKDGPPKIEVSSKKEGLLECAEELKMCRSTKHHHQNMSMGWGSNRPINRSGSGSRHQRNTSSTDDTTSKTTVTSDNNSSNTIPPPTIGTFPNKPRVNPTSQSQPHTNNTTIQNHNKFTTPPPNPNLNENIKFSRIGNGAGNGEGLPLETLLGKKANNNSINTGMNINNLSTNSNFSGLHPSLEGIILNEGPSKISTKALHEIQNAPHHSISMNRSALGRRMIAQPLAQYPTKQQNSSHFSIRSNDATQGRIFYKQNMSGGSGTGGLIHSDYRKQDNTGKSLDLNKKINGNGHSQSSHFAIGGIGNRSSECQHSAPPTDIIGGHQERERAHYMGHGHPRPIDKNPRQYGGNKEEANQSHISNHNNHPPGANFVNGLSNVQNLKVVQSVESSQVPGFVPMPSINRRGVRAPHPTLPLMTHSKINPPTRPIRPTNKR